MSDFFTQIFCYFSNKNPLVQKKRILDNTMFHALSIETILEKFYTIEVMRIMNLTDIQSILVNNLYYDTMKNENSNSNNKSKSTPSSVENIFGLTREKIEDCFK